MPEDDEQAESPAEHDTESSEQLEEETPTEEHEPTATETQASDLETVEVLADEIQELRARAAERDDLLDKLQRSRADFINFQKRSQREHERWKDRAIQDIVLRILPALDDFERALGHSRDSQDVETLIHGFELIHSKMLGALEGEGVAPFDAVGKQFDPAYHEAVAHVHNPAVPDQQIVEVLRVGYMMGDHVVRAAQVVVAKGGPPPLPAGVAEPALESDDEETSDLGPA